MPDWTAVTGTAGADYITDNGQRSDLTVQFNTSFTLHVIDANMMFGNPTTTSINGDFLFEYLSWENQHGANGVPVTWRDASKFNPGKHQLPLPMVIAYDSTNSKLYAVWLSKVNQNYFSSFEDGCTIGVEPNATGGPKITFHYNHYGSGAYIKIKQVTTFNDVYDALPAVLQTARSNEMEPWAWVYYNETTGFADDILTLTDANHLNASNIIVSTSANTSLTWGSKYGVWRPRDWAKFAQFIDDLQDGGKKAYPYTSLVELWHEEYCRPLLAVNEAREIDGTETTAFDARIGASGAWHADMAHLPVEFKMHSEWVDIASVADGIYVDWSPVKDATNAETDYYNSSAYWTLYYINPRNNDLNVYWTLLYIKTLFSQSNLTGKKIIFNGGTPVSRQEVMQFADCMLDEKTESAGITLAGKLDHVKGIQSITPVPIIDFINQRYAYFWQNIYGMPYSDFLAFHIGPAIMAGNAVVTRFAPLQMANDTSKPYRDIWYDYVKPFYDLFNAYKTYFNGCNARTITKVSGGNLAFIDSQNYWKGLKTSDGNPIVWEQNSATGGYTARITVEPGVTSSSRVSIRFEID